MDTKDKQILGILDCYGGLDLLVDLNALEFQPKFQFDSKAVLEAKVACLN